MGKHFFGSKLGLFGGFFPRVELFFYCIVKPSLKNFNEGFTKFFFWIERQRPCKDGNANNNRYRNKKVSREKTKDEVCSPCPTGNVDRLLERKWPKEFVFNVDVLRNMKLHTFIIQHRCRIFKCSTAKLATLTLTVRDKGRA